MGKIFAAVTVNIMYLTNVLYFVIAFLQVRTGQKSWPTNLQLKCRPTPSPKRTFLMWAELRGYCSIFWHHFSKESWRKMQQHECSLYLTLKTGLYRPCFVESGEFKRKLQLWIFMLLPQEIVLLFIVNDTYTHTVNSIIKSVYAAVAEKRLLLVYPSVINSCYKIWLLRCMLEK